MFGKTLKSSMVAAVAAVVGMVGFGGMANASPVGPVDLVSGGTYAGWKITFNNDIELTQDAVTDGLNLRLTKIADFKFANQGLVIRFEQVAANADKDIQILEEIITNNSGVNWGEFDMGLANVPNAGVAKFTAAFASNDVSPFSNVAFTDDVITIDGGTFQSGQTHTFGAGASFVNINVAGPETGFARFFLKEVPVEGNPGPGPGVPLPAAAWTGLSGLAGMAVVAFRRKARGLIA